MVAVEMAEKDEVDGAQVDPSALSAGRDEAPQPTRKDAPPAETWKAGISPSATAERVAAVDDLNAHAYTTG
jgi:hypothetical protein